MAKTQPLQVAPPSSVQPAPVKVTAASKPAARPPAGGSMLEIVDNMPAPILWTIFGASALVFILQLWTYLA